MINLPPGARLQVKAVSVRFSGIRVLQDVSFNVEPGTVHAVIGPNGAGKSSLFNVLSGIYKPTEGSVLLDDYEVVGRIPHKIAHAGVGRAFQNSSMFSSLTVEENLMLGRHRLTRAGVLGTGLGLPFGRKEERKARESVREVANFLGIERLLERPAGDLPYGEAKQVDVARALCTEPKILLLDEPAAGMHTHEKTAMRETIKRISSDLGTTILLVEHDMGLVINTSDRITALNFGTVLLTGTPDEVSNDPRVIEAYLGHSKSKSDVSQGVPASNKQTAETAHPPAAEDSESSPAETDTDD